MKHTANRALSLILALALLLSLAACGGKNAAENTDQEPVQDEAGSAPAGDDAQQTGEDFNGKLVSEGFMPLDYAENFSIELYQGGYRTITVDGYGSFLVVPEGMSVPQELAEDVAVLCMPIDRVYSASTGMTSLIAAMGALDHVKLVSTAAESWYLTDVAEKMNEGAIGYSGKYSEPDYEQMTAQEIQFHVDSQMIDNCPEVMEKFDELGIPSMVETSSKESHPLGRVEWVKVFGVLFGMEDEAARYFDEQKALLESATAAGSSGKTVAMGYITSSDKCYSRNGGDYMAQMIGLAGGEYILAGMEPDQAGNTNMTFEEWYAKNKDADCLFYINFARSFRSIQEMIDYNPLFADFKAVQEGNVWITSPDFTQSTAAIASIVSDMHTILFSADGDVTTDHLIKLS